RRSTRSAPNSVSCHMYCEMYGPARSPGVRPRKRVPVVTAFPTVGPPKREKSERTPTALTINGLPSYSAKGTSLVRDIQLLSRGKLRRPVSTAESGWRLLNQGVGIGGNHLKGQSGLWVGELPGAGPSCRDYVFKVRGITRCHGLNERRIGSGVNLTEAVMRQSL